MTDRELLEAAARAAGYVGRIGHEWRGGMAFCIHAEDGQFLKNWNPLTDDADALRLAVKVGMIINIIDNGTTIVDGVAEFEEQNEADHSAATRRAIVRAAAAMAPSGKPELQAPKTSAP